MFTVIYKKCKNRTVVLFGNFFGLLPYFSSRDYYLHTPEYLPRHLMCIFFDLRFLWILWKCLFVTGLFCSIMVLMCLWFSLIDTRRSEVYYGKTHFFRVRHIIGNRIFWYFHVTVSHSHSWQLNVFMNINVTAKPWLSIKMEALPLNNQPKTKVAGTLKKNRSWQRRITAL